jgi:DNA invertase Pin-like site-specific DNA recombinase
VVKERIATSTPARRLMRTMFADVAEFEWESIAARTTDGRNARGRKDGERGGRVRYGYRRCDGETLSTRWPRPAATAVQLSAVRLAAAPMARFRRHHRRASPSSRYKRETR